MTENQIRSFGKLGSGLGLVHHGTQNTAQNHHSLAAILLTFLKIIRIYLSHLANFVHTAFLNMYTFTCTSSTCEPFLSATHDRWASLGNQACLYKWSQAVFLVFLHLGLFMPFLCVTEDVVCGWCQSVAAPCKAHVQWKKGQTMKATASGVACTHTQLMCLPKSISAGSSNHFIVLATLEPSVIENRGPSGDQVWLPAGKLWLIYLLPLP